MSFNNLSDMEIDAIGEIVNIGFGVASTAVSTLIRSRITITVPEVKVNELSIEDREEERSIVEIKYLSGMTGTNILVLTKENRNRFVNLMMNTNLQSEEISKEISMSAACELMNQMMGAMATGLSDFLERKVNISTPISFEIENSEQIRQKYLSSETPVVTTKFVMKSENGFYGEFWNIMSLEEVRKLVEECMPEYPEEEEVSQEMVKKEREEEDTKKIQSPYTKEYKRKIKKWPIVLFGISFVLAIIISVVVIKTINREPAISSELKGVNWYEYTY